MELVKMNPEVKAKWLAALRSGDYGQGKSELRSADGEAFCCLGVLCDLHAGVADEKWSENGIYLGKAFDLPLTVSKWAGLDEARDIKIPVELVPHERRWDNFASNGSRDTVWISELNDHGYTFAEIADLIEAHL